MAEDFENIDEYIRSFPDDVQVILEKIRRTIHKALPKSGEKISYKIPTITLDDRYVVYFAGWKNHVSVYPVPVGDAVFEEEIAPYRAAKGTLKFPLSKPIPYDLITRAAKLLAKQRT